MKRKTVFLLFFCIMLALCGCGHEHIWKNATCSEPKTCIECGATEGQALGHTWTEADCTTPKTCAVCGVTEGEPNGHSWAEATCTEPEVCSVCGEKGQAAKGHIVTAWTVEKEASCTEEGVEAGTCDACGEPQTRSIARKEHEFGEWKTISAATCTEPGTELRTCAVCGEEEKSEIPIIDHEEGDWETIEEATYSASGTRVQSCKVCGKELNRESYSLSDDERIAWLKKNCKTNSYNDLERNPNAHTGEYVKFTCYILQVVSDADSEQSISIYRAATKGKWDDDILLLISNYGEERILKDDKLTVYGIFTGLYTYSSVMGASITIPQVVALHYE